MATSPSDETAEAVARSVSDVPVGTAGLDLIDALANIGADMPERVLCDIARAAISAHLDALKSQGMVIVPAMPTKAMVRAGNMCGFTASVFDITADVYRAMISAAEGK